jgi:uncharacterized protein with von Willebrand factor type A (vWA) domain
MYTHTSMIEKKEKRNKMSWCSELVGEWSQSSHMGDTYSELVVEWSQDSHMGDTYSEVVVKWIILY